MSMNGVQATNKKKENEPSCDEISLRILDLVCPNACRGSCDMHKKPETLTSTFWTTVEMWQQNMATAL